MRQSLTQQRPGGVPLPDSVGKCRGWGGGVRGKPAGCATGCMCGGPGAARPFWAVGPRDGPSPLPDPGPAPLPTPVQAVRPVLPGAPPPPPQGGRAAVVWGCGRRTPPKKKNTSARSPHPSGAEAAAGPTQPPGRAASFCPGGRECVPAPLAPLLHSP